MVLSPIWRVTSAANAGSGAAVRGRRHVLPSRGTVVDWRKGCFTPWTFPFLPEVKGECTYSSENEQIKFLYKDNTTPGYSLSPQPKTVTKTHKIIHLKCIGI